VALGTDGPITRPPTVEIGLVTAVLVGLFLWERATAGAGVRDPVAANAAVVFVFEAGMQAR
jgi:hypothetical protein